LITNFAELINQFHNFITDINDDLNQLLHQFYHEQTHFSINIFPSACFSAINNQNGLIFILSSISNLLYASGAGGRCCGTSPHGGSPERPSGDEQNKG